MNMIVNLIGEFITIIDVKRQEVIGVIENDFGLIRYILKILRRYEISITKKGKYLQFENKEGETYLHRIIIEYYSQFNTKLYTILTNPDYEVNHKNKNVWDNRLENLEIVTRIGNERHKRGLNYEVIMTSEEIIEIKNKLKEDNQYQSDKKYLEKVSSKSHKILSKEFHKYWGEKKALKEFFDNLYIRFNNNTIPTLKTTQNTTNINDLRYFKDIIFIQPKNTFLGNYYNINGIIILYNIYRSIPILHNLLKLILKYYYKNKYFKNILHKYYILDLENYNFNGINMNEHLNHNIILDLVYLLKGSRYITFYKNQLFTTISIKDLFLTYKKHNSFRVLYYLKLLKRQKIFYNPTSHTASGFIIPELTDDFFISTILPRAKELYEAGLIRLTYTNVARNFEFEVADLVYKNSKLKEKAQKDFITIDNINNLFLYSTTLNEKIRLHGFITLNDLVRELQIYHEQKRISKNNKFRR